MPQEKICYVVGAGDFFSRGFSPQPDDFLIAADAGYLRLQHMSLEPDIIIGDFDSLGAPPRHPHVIPLKKEKDETDMIAALSEGFSRGYRRFHIFGGTGKRLDHTLANLQALAWLAQRDARGILFGEAEQITAIKDSALFFPEGSAGTVSMFAHSDNAYGVNIYGLKYPLKDSLVTNQFPIGVSNELTGKTGCISVRQGTLWVLYPVHVDPMFGMQEDCSTSPNML